MKQKIKLCFATSAENKSLVTLPVAFILVKNRTVYISKNQIKEVISNSRKVYVKTVNVVLMIVYIIPMSIVVIVVKSIDDNISMGKK